jgi:hypothetical protein
MEKLWDNVCSALDNEPSKTLYLCPSGSIEDLTMQLTLSLSIS